MLYIPRWHLAFVAFVAQALDANGDGRTHPLGNPQHPRRLFAETHLCSRLRVRTGQVVKINLAGQEFGENELRTTPQTFFQIFQQFFNPLLSDPVIFCHIRPNFKTQCGAESKFWKLRTLFISIKGKPLITKPDDFLVAENSLWAQKCVRKSSLEIFSLKKDTAQY